LSWRFQRAAPAARFVLDRMDGRARLEDLARALVAESPSRWTSWPRALDFVAALSARYGR
jgi:hypothetical protein